MDQDALIAELQRATKDREPVDAIVRRLAEPGADAAPGLVAAVGTVSPSALWGLRDALRLIGPPAFDVAVAARTRADEVPDWWELGHVLRGFDERCVPQYRAALTHPVKDVRHQALGGLANLGEAAAVALTDVIPFLDAPDSSTRYTAAQTVRAIGEGSGPVLAGIRRNGPARLRRHALTALAVIGEADLLDERDRRALQRLIRVKAAQDIPEALPDHQWIAVPGATYEGLFEAIGLHDRIPCTLSMGLSAAENDSVDFTDPDGTRHTAYRVFVTPELDGWRLVYANTPLSPAVWKYTDVIERISAACGQAQFFAQDEHSDSMIWAVALDGVLRRRYWRNESPEWVGEPMDWETPLTDDPDYDPAEEYAPNATTETDTNGAAWALSLVPEDIDDDTTLRGHGWLAISRAGVGHTAFAGALRI